jgi:predicted esterase
VREFAPLDDGSRLIVAPEGLSRFYLGEVGERPASERRVGASWMTREDRLAEIDDQVRYLDAVYAEVLQGIDRCRSRVCVFGFSQGTAVAARWLGYGTARASRLILWGGEIPPDLDLSVERERFTRLDLTLVAGTRDQFITTKILDREKQRLDAHAIPFHLVTFEGGHEIDEAVLRQVTG